MLSLKKRGQRERGKTACGGKKLHALQKDLPKQKRRGWRGRGGIDIIKENRYNKSITMLLSGAAPLMA